MSQDIEIEIKLPLLNKEQLAAFLDQNAEIVFKDSWQKDTYYTPDHRDFLSYQYPYEWLRTRETDRGFSVNYKHFFPENVVKTDYCDEFETTVEKIDQIKKIFAALNIKEVVVIEKIRSAWNYQDTEIVIDQVVGLGDYIEIEAKKDFASAQDAKDHLRNVLAQINAQTGSEDLRGYPFQLLAKQGYKFG